MARIMRGDPLKKQYANYTVKQWEKQIRLNASKSESAQIDEFHLKSSSLTMYIIFLTWIFGVLQIFSPWGMKFVLIYLYFLLYFGDEKI